MAKYWGRSQATRELAFSIYHSRAKENIATKIEEIINPQTRARLETYSKELAKAQLELEDSYNNILNSIFSNDSILDDLADILSKTTYEQNEQNLLTNFFKNNTSITNENFKQDITTYVNNYNRMYDGMINASEEVTHIMEKFRGDRQLYGIGTSSSLSIMSASAYSSLERNNRDLFSLKFKESSSGSYQKLDQLQVADKYSIRDLKSRIANELYGGDVLTDILNSQFSTSSNTTFKQVWKELKNNQIYSSAAYGKNDQELNEMKNTTKYAWRARKLEYLFNEDILQGIENIDQLNYKISNSENTLGFATGDVNIKTTINQQDYSFAIQLKYAGGSKPWNGTSISSLQNSLKFLSNKDGLFSEFPTPKPPLFK